LADGPDYLREFLATVEPYLSQWRSLKFACMAVRVGNEWVQFAGRVMLKTEPCEPQSVLKRIVDLDDFRAYEASYQVKTVHNLISNLTRSMVISESAAGEILRLTPTGSKPYYWHRASVRSSSSGFNDGRSWPGILYAYGTGSFSDSLFPTNFWAEIDKNLLAHEPPYNGYSGLCAYLGLDFKQLQTTPHFELSAELPARFVSGEVDRVSKFLKIKAEYVGMPDLVVEWLPGHQTKKEPTPQGDPQVPHSFEFTVRIPQDATKVEAKLITMGEHADTLMRRVNWENTLLRLCEFFDPDQARLTQFLFDESNLKNVNPFELGVARLLGLAGYTVLWFGKGAKASLPDIVAHMCGPLGEERIIYGECTLKNPAEKFSDLARRTDGLRKHLGVEADTILPMVFVRNNTADQDRRSAADFGLALCDGNDLRQLQEKIKSDATPEEVFQLLRSLGGLSLIPGGVTSLFT
jgi:hypothetical protein